MHMENVSSLTLLRIYRRNQRTRRVWVNARCSQRRKAAELYILDQIDRRIDV
jgi:hypothetical protein